MQSDKGDLRAKVIVLPENNPPLELFESLKMEGYHVESSPGVRIRDMNKIDEMHLSTFWRLHSREPLKGEIGCLRAHQLLWEKIAQNSESNFVLICEEDAEFVKASEIAEIQNDLRKLTGPWIVQVSFGKKTVLAHRQPFTKQVLKCLVPPTLTSAYFINRPAAVIASKHKEAVDLADWPWWMHSINFGVSSTRIFESTEDVQRSNIGVRKKPRSNIFIRQFRKILFILQAIKDHGLRVSALAIKRAFGTPFVYAILSFGHARSLLKKIGFYVY